MSADAPDNLIQFHTDPEHVGDPAPFRAVQNLPDWFKQMPASTESPGYGAISTLKLCSPFVEAMGAGYIMPQRGPVRFTRHHDGRLEIANLEFQTTGLAVDEQPPLALRGSPFQGMLIVKFLNHWIIKTPPGYSCLILPVLNQFTIPFQVLSGVVETDTYYRGVNFPAICILEPGQQITLARGTAIAQVIPFKREAWKSESGPWDETEAKAAAEQAEANLHHYKDNNWVKKEFR